MYVVTLEKITQKEQKIKKILEGRDPQDINLPENLKTDLKRYQGLILQYNANALYTACVQPYINKFSSKEISHLEFKAQFEQKRYKTLLTLCTLKPTKINELLSEINRNSYSIFKNAVDPTIKNLLFNLKEEYDRNLMICDSLDNFEAINLSI